jgi:hypothetical protein
MYTKLIGIISLDFTLTDNLLCYNKAESLFCTYQKWRENGNTMRQYISYLQGKKGKAVPLQAWSGPEGSRKLRFPDYMTTAQDDGKVVSLTHRPPLPPGNTPGTHFC